MKKRLIIKTKAIIPVHLYGQPIKNFDKLLKIAKKYSLYIIEDCAQAVFAKYKNQYVGTFGDFGTISFYPGKNLGAYGDAGLVISNNDDLANKVRMLANHGQKVKHIHIYEGINSRMDGIQGNILNVKLKYILEWTDRRQKIAKLYFDLLKNVQEIVLPEIDEESTHVFHLYVARVQKREALKKYLQDKGIGTAIHYPNLLPFLDCYKYLEYKEDDFPVGNSVSKEIISLPMFPELEDKDVRFVCNEIKNFYS